MVILMVIYVDIIIIINFIFDYITLLITDLLLKRNTNFKNVFLGAIAGELSLITLFLSINKVILILFKSLLLILMIIITFGYKSIKYSFNNFIYLMLSYFVLGGFMYYLMITFLDNKILSFKYLMIVLLTLLFSFIYVRLLAKIKNNYNNQFKVVIKYNENIFIGKGYLDSANNLTSPYSGKPVILIEKKYINYQKLKLLPVSYNSLNHSGLIYCFKPEEILINNTKYNALVGLSDNSFNNDCEVLLNNRMGIL